jgi:hypothetical protein
LYGIRQPHFFPPQAASYCQNQGIQKPEARQEAPFNFRHVIRQIAGRTKTKGGSREPLSENDVPPILRSKKLVKPPNLWITRQLTHKGEDIYFQKLAG